MAWHAAPNPLARQARPLRLAILNAMTKVQLTLPLSRTLTDADFVSISRMHSVYGFMAVRFKPASNELFIEYDASRLTSKEVRASLEEHGLPVAAPPSPQAPPSRPADIAAG